MFELKLLGGAAIRAADGQIGGRAAQRRRLALLALLAVRGDKPLSRDKVIALLWPEKDSEQGRHLLSESLYIIRKSFGDKIIVAQGDDLRLNPEVVRSDVAEFEGALQGNNPREAVASYGGPFLDGFFLKDAGEFERWTEAERIRLGRAFAGALEQLAREEEQRANPAAAVDWWRRLAAQDPFNERVAMSLMAALEAAGDRAGALQHGRLYQALWREEFGGEPGPAVMALSRQLQAAPAWAGSGAPVRTEATPAKPAAAAPEAAISGSAEESASDRRFLRTRWNRAALLLVAVLVAMAAVWAATRAPAGRSTASVAVLPFVNMSPDIEAEYFSEGMTEELINALARVEGLRVPARTSSFQFKGRALDVKEVGNRLQVGAVVEGSVRREGRALRVTAQLIDTENGYHLWSQTYDRELSAVFSVQEEIARGIVRALLPRLMPGAGALPLVRPGTTDPEAHALYLRGRYAWNKRTPEGLQQAARYFRQAIDRDPLYARAYSGLADTYLTLFDYELLPAAEANPLARVAIARALEIDSALGEAHNSWAHLLLHNWEWQESLAEFRRALELDPGQASTYHWYALALTTVGLVADAVEAMQRAHELDPLSARMSADLGMAYFAARKYDDAIRQERKTLVLQPSLAGAHWIMGMAYEQKGLLAEAAAAFDRALEGQADNPNFLAARARAHALAGQRTEARRMLDTLLRHRPPASFFIALVYTALGDRDSAFVWLERSLDERAGSVRYLKVDPRLDPLRPDLQFMGLLRRARLPL